MPPDADDVTLQAMCRAGLTESALTYAAAQRQLAATNADLYARWTQRLMECEAQAALRNVDDASLHWARCAELRDAFERSQPKHPRTPWLTWQASRCQLLQAQDHVARWLAAPAAVQHREQALEIIREVLTELDNLEADIKLRQPLAAKLAPNDLSQAPAEQLAQLRLETVLLRCEAFLTRSRLYDSGSRDRVAAATEVESQATPVLDRADQLWSSRASLEVARAAAWLEIGRADAGIAQLQKLAQSAGEQVTRTRAAVIAVEWLVANQQLSQARVFADLLKMSEAGVEAELADMRLRLAELGNLTTAKKEAELSQLLKQANSIGTRYGDYWHSRAESILAGKVTGDQLQTSTALELAVVEVRQLLAAGKTQPAIDKLLATSRNEQAALRGETAIRFASQAVALLHRQQEWEAAADLLEPLTQQFQAANGAAEAHVLAIWSIAQALRLDPQNAPMQLKYGTLLRQHLRLWPDSTSSPQILQWVRDWQIAINKQAELLTIYRELAITSKQPEHARQAIYAWFEEAIAADTTADEIELLRQTIAEERLKAIETTARVVRLTAATWTTWPEPVIASESNQEMRELQSKVIESLDQSLLSGTKLVMAARDSDDAQAIAFAQSLATKEFSSRAQGALLRACLETIDAWPIESQLTWPAALMFGPEQLAALDGSKSPADQVAACRWRIRLDLAATENLTRLRSICDQHTQNANLQNASLQLQLSEALAQSGSSAQADSTAIAKRVAASAPKNSELYLAARWRILKNQQLAGQRTEAARAASLLLATQSIESGLWKSRFASIASNK